MTKGLMVLMLAGYAVTIWITYEILKVSIKDALKELKAAEKAQAKKEAQEMLTAKIQD
jgi:hypothetical protein